MGEGRVGRRQESSRWHGDVRQTGREKGLWAMEGGKEALEREWTWTESTCSRPGAKRARGQRGPWEGAGGQAARGREAEARQDRREGDQVTQRERYHFRPTHLAKIKKLGHTSVGEDGGQ